MTQLRYQLAACAVLTLTACASRDAISARQAPQPLVSQTVRVDAASPFPLLLTPNPLTVNPESFPTCSWQLGHSFGPSSSPVCSSM